MHANIAPVVRSIAAAVSALLDHPCVGAGLIFLASIASSVIDDCAAAGVGAKGGLSHRLSVDHESPQPDMPSSCACLHCAAACFCRIGSVWHANLCLLMRCRYSRHGAASAEFHDHHSGPSHRCHRHAEASLPRAVLPLARRGRLSVVSALLSWIAHTTRCCPLQHTGAPPSPAELQVVLYPVSQLPG